MPSHAKVRLVLWDEHEDAVEVTTTAPPTSVQPPVRNAIYRAREWLLDRQHPDGYWEGEVEGDSTLESEYILLQAWLNQAGQHLETGDGLAAADTFCQFGHWRQDSAGCRNVRKAAQRLINQQLPDGGWAKYPGGALEISASVRAYFALKLTGHEPHAASMQRAREAILRTGGADTADGPTRRYLAMLGQIPYSACTLAPAEPIPPVTQVDLRWGIRELFLKHPTAWPAIDESCVPDRSVQPVGGRFQSLARMLINLKCQRLREDSPAMQDGLQAVESLVIDHDKTLSVQPFKLPAQDTALAIRALCEAGIEPSEPVLRDAAARLLELTTPDCRNLDELATAAIALPLLATPTPQLHEIPFPGLRLASTVEAYEVFDEVAQDGLLLEQTATALEVAERRLRAVQNRDGGWTSNSYGSSTPDATCRALDALAANGCRIGGPAVDRAVAFLRESQQPDGSWSGHSGVNYIFGTWQVLTGLAAVGLPCNDPAIQAGANWLLSYQQSCGGWGESPESYANPAMRGQGPVTATQTAWALLGLLAAGLTDDPAVLHGVRYLVSSQDDDGTWHEPEFTSTEVAGISYVRFDLHRVCYPLLALARFATH